jgi:hypothetical protein
MHTSFLDRESGIPTKKEREETMHKKILHVLFAVLLMATLTLAAAAPAAAADQATRQAAVISTADNLVTLQNADGGFPWKIVDSPAASASNCLGVTAMGILEGWKIDSKADYDTALAKAYKYIADTPPAYTWDGINKYAESTKGVDSFSDMTFMVKLADAANSDADLLAAIQAQVPGTEVADIVTLAKNRWDNRLLYLGDNDGAEEANGTATGIAEYIRDVRAGSYPGLITWDLELGVEAALALNDVYPGEGYNSQAAEIAEVIYASVDDDGEEYFSSTDTNQNDYILGLTGAIKAYEETGLHTDAVPALLSLLLNEQQTDGYWNYYGDEPVAMSVQSTAYAAMALMAEGSAEAVAAANDAADWMVSSQQAEGWWYSEGGEGDEYAEIDSEAAWAIAILADGSSSVSMTASYVPPVPQIGISVTPTAVSFGSVEPGVASSPQTVTVANTGNVIADVSASVQNESVAGVYSTGLTIDAAGVAAWNDSVAVEGNITPELILTVPAETNPGTYTATLVFWAEAQ